MHEIKSYRKSNRKIATSESLPQFFHHFFGYIWWSQRLQGFAEAPSLLVPAAKLHLSLVIKEMLLVKLSLSFYKYWCPFSGNILCYPEISLVICFLATCSSGRELFACPLSKDNKLTQFYSPMLNTTAFPISPMCAKSKQGGSIADMEANIRHRWIKTFSYTQTQLIKHECKVNKFHWQTDFFFKLLLKADSPTNIKTWHQPNLILLKYKYWQNWEQEIQKVLVS